MCGCGGTDGGDWTGEVVVEVGFVGWVGCCGGVACDDCVAVVEMISWRGISMMVVICLLDWHLWCLSAILANRIA